MGACLHWHTVLTECGVVVTVCCDLKFTEQMHTKGRLEVCDHLGLTVKLAAPPLCIILHILRVDIKR
jgi:hypothetical protein